MCSASYNCSSTHTLIVCCVPPVFPDTAITGARKWYDFDVRPSDATEPSLRASRRLDHQPHVFDIIDGLKKTMIDELECTKWLDKRKEYNDLFAQVGHSSTIIVETEDITLHIQYKQENVRCNAHSIDVWISSVSRDLVAETWEGIIGETKNPAFTSNGKQTSVDRLKVLKFERDSDYEVMSPFSTNCKGCI
jgi:hypothetical protein